jgi:hypothetical protein
MAITLATRAKKLEGAVVMAAILAEIGG